MFSKNTSRPHQKRKQKRYRVFILDQIDSCVVHTPVAPAPPPSPTSPHPHVSHPHSTAFSDGSYLPIILVLAPPPSFLLGCEIRNGGGDRPGYLKSPPRMQGVGITRNRRVLMTTMDMHRWILEWCTRSFSGRLR